MDKKSHWENVFETKARNEVSWFQEYPKTSVDFFIINSIPKEAKIIEVGGGDSALVDVLLELGYTNITVLDISENAINRLKKRLGDKANAINFVVSDVLDFETDERFDVWHDRASFHFLTTEDEIQRYVQKVIQFTNPKAILFLGTFSENGPLKCSGLEIKQYNERTLNDIFKDEFELFNSFIENHLTPFNTLQNFIFCEFRK